MSSSRRDTLVAWLVGLLLALGIVGGSRLLDFTHQIQQERYQQTYDQCAAQNARHDNTLAALDQILGQAEKKQPKQAARIAASKAPTVLLINSLAPKHDCTVIAHMAVRQ